MPLCKECCVACGRCLYYFVLHGEQIHGELTRCRVGTKHDSFFLESGICHHLSVINRSITYALVHRISAHVVRIVHDLGGVVTLKHEDELQVVTQVVFAQAKSVLEVSLVVTAGHTTYESHFRLVVESHAIQRFGQRKSVLSLLYMQNAVSLEGMSGLEHLQLTGLRGR